MSRSLVQIPLRTDVLVVLKHRSCPLSKRPWVSVTNTVEERIGKGDFLAHRTRSNTRSRISTKIKTAMQQLDHLSCGHC